MAMAMAPSMTMKQFGTSFPDGKTSLDVEKMIENQDVLEVDTIAFEEKDLLRVRQKLGAEFAKYQRIPNPNYKVRSAKLYAKNGGELFTIVPNVDQFGIQIHIKDTSGETGKIEIHAKPNVNNFSTITIEYTIKTDFFNKPYTFHFISNMDVTTKGLKMDMKNRSQYVLYYEGKPVLGHITVFDFSNSDKNRTNIITDHNFFIEHREDLAAWCLIFILIEDVNRQLAADNPPNTNNQLNTNNQFSDDFNKGPTFNSDGSVNNNHNPFDKF
jgi:hypothetical protein